MVAFASVLLVGLAAELGINCGNSHSGPSSDGGAAACPDNNTLGGMTDGGLGDASGEADPAVANGTRMIQEGQRIFRFDTFGSETFWGDQLRLHHAIAGQANGGVGPGLSPSLALRAGLKVDVDALPPELQDQLRNQRVDLNSPDTTLALLRLNAVVGVTGFFNSDTSIRSVGIQCALCHSTVDNSFAEGIGHRLDGWPNRDLNVGAIIDLAPTVQPFATLLRLDENAVRTVLRSWGPGRFDPLLILDGRAVRPDGRTAAVLLPPAFGFAGVNLHTYTGFGSVPYWNALVANLEMMGQGTFVDERLDDASQFPVAARAQLGHRRSERDLITSKLPALQLYQLSLPIPSPPSNSFDAAAASRGRTLFEGQARCASCHVPPLFTEPGYNAHAPAEIGIDDFQASRSPERRYRTTPLRGLFTRQRGGFYHDGRFADLNAVVAHYNDHLRLNLTAAQQNDLVEFLKSL